MHHLRLALIAVSLGLDCFAVSIGVGLRGTDARTQFRMGAAFACAEILMNLAGAGLGAVAGTLLGSAAGYLGFAALFVVGLYMIYEARFTGDTHKPLDLTTGWGLVVAALSISLDSLGIGFSILFIGVPLMTSLITVGAVSVVSTFLGLRFGAMLGQRAEEAAGLWAGIILALTGLGFAAEKYFSH